MQQYELMLMLFPDLGEKALGEAIAEIKDFIDGLGGKISQEDVWGVRDLAYRIKKHDQGYYLVWNLELPGSTISEMERTLNINQSVMRYLLLNTPDSYKFKTLAQYEEEALQAALEAEKEAKEGQKEPASEQPEPKKAPVKAPKKAESKEEKEELDAKLSSIVDDPDISL